MPLEREALTLLLLNPGLAAEQAAASALPFRDEWARALGEAWIAAVKACRHATALEGFVDGSRSGRRPTWRAACWPRPGRRGRRRSTRRRSRGAPRLPAAPAEAAAGGAARAICRHSSGRSAATRDRPALAGSRTTVPGAAPRERRAAEQAMQEPAVAGRREEELSVATTTTTETRPKGGTTEAKPKATAKPPHARRPTAEGRACEGTSHQGHGNGQGGGHGKPAAAKNGKATKNGKAAIQKPPATATPVKAAPRSIDNGRGRQGTAQGSGSEADRRPRRRTSRRRPSRRRKAASPSRTAAGQNGKACAAAIEGLLRRVASEGFITQDQILEAIPQPEEHLGPDRGAVRGGRGERRRGPGRGQPADPDRRARGGGRGRAGSHQGRGTGRGGPGGAGRRPHRHRRPGPDVPQGDRQGRPADRRGGGGAGQGDRAGREGRRGPGTSAGRPLHVGQHQLRAEGPQHGRHARLRPAEGVAARHARRGRLVGRAQAPHRSRRRRSSCRRRAGRRTSTTRPASGSCTPSRCSSCSARIPAEALKQTRAVRAHAIGSRPLDHAGAHELHGARALGARDGAGHRAGVHRGRATTPRTCASLGYDPPSRWRSRWRSAPGGWSSRASTPASG